MSFFFMAARRGKGDLTPRNVLRIQPVCDFALKWTRKGCNRMQKQQYKDNGEHHHIMLPS
jgi:hypothetical protein